MTLQDTLPQMPSLPLLQPSLPDPNSGISYWHRTTRAFAYLNANKFNPTPVEAQYVIIGAGIAGAYTAYKLLEAGIDPHQILILEAREAVSGSSGRNAGHVRPEAFRNFASYATTHGTDEALRIMENELHVLDLTSKFVQECGIPCDFSLKPTFDVCLTQEIADEEAMNVKKYAEAGGNMDHIRKYEGEKIKERLGIDGAVAAYEWPAASIHPAKLAQWLLTNIIERGCKLWTHCPASAVTPGQKGHWDIHTPRGIVSCERVVHCTNAWAGCLIPQLSSDLLVPVKIQVHSLIPTLDFSDNYNILHKTMALRYQAQLFYALIQMESDGTIIFGTSRPAGIGYDESTFKQDFANESLRQFDILFPSNSGEYPQPKKHGEGLDHAWTGLIAVTPDSAPYVGEIDGRRGQYVCAGFNGHGMARIFSCAPAVVRLMLGGNWSDTGLPDCFQYSQERLSKVQGLNATRPPGA